MSLRKILLTVGFLLCASVVFAAYTDNGDNTVTDSITGLMWQQEDDNTTRTWEAAITYCEDLTLAGYGDWRLPNINELESIADDTVFSPAIDTVAFPNTNSSGYWSSTTFAFSTGYAWGVSFHGGYVYSSNKTYSDYFRCVRGGQ